MATAPPIAAACRRYAVTSSSPESRRSSRWSIRPCGTIECNWSNQSTTHAPSRSAFDRPRRRHHRIRRRRRHGDEGAGRPRHPRAADGSRPDGQHGRLQDAAGARTSVWHRGAGEPATLYTTGQGTPLSFNASFAANHRRRALHRGARQPVPLVPLARHRRAHQPLRRACSCATPTTTSSPSRCAASAATGRSATTTWRRTTTRPNGSSASPAGRRAAQRARRHLPDAGAVQAARGPRPAGLRQARASRRPTPRQAVITEPAERPARLHLLRAVRPRLQVRRRTTRRATCRSSRR